MLADPWIGCGKCAPCLRNEDNLCTAMRSLGVFSNGGYADYMMVPHPRYLFDIGDLPPERVAPLACSGVTTFGALKKVTTLKREPTVIIGAGGLGLMCLALHQKMGGHSAIVVDIDPAKRDAAKQAGAAAVIDGKAPDAIAQIQALTNGGAWAVIDVVGSTQSAALGYGSLIKGGKYIIVGLYGGDFTRVAAADPDARADHPGLLRRQRAGDDRTDGARAPHRAARRAGHHAPAGRGQRRARRSARRQDRRPRGAHAGFRLM